MEAFLKLTGSEYLHATLDRFIETFQGSEDLYDCEIDPMKLTQGASLAKNQENLRRAVDSVWKQIVQSHAIFPMWVVEKKLNKYIYSLENKLRGRGVILRA